MEPRIRSRRPLAALAAAVAALSFAPVDERPLHAQGAAAKRPSESTASRRAERHTAWRERMRKAALKHRGRILQAKAPEGAFPAPEAAVTSGRSTAHESPSVGEPIRQGGTTRVVVRDVGPELGPSWSVAGFIIDRDHPRQILLPAARSFFRSADGGRHWSPAALVSRRGFADGTFFVRQDPSNPRVLFAVKEGFYSPGPAEEGIYRSGDFGATWTRLDGISDPPADCAINEASPNEVLLLSQLPFGQEPVWRSSDGGFTFEPQTGTGLPRFVIDEETGESPVAPIYTNIATTPANPDIVYVVLYADEMGVLSPAVYKSVDRGHTFVRLEAGPPRPLQVFPHPTRANVLFVQDGDSLPNVHRSMDGGLTFEPVGAGLPQDRWTYFVAFDPNNPSFVFVAGQGGLFRSKDWGRTFRPSGLAGEHVGLGATTVSIDPTNPDVIYVNTSRGNFKSMDGGASFTAINTGWRAASIAHIAFDRDRKPNLYVAAENGGGILKTRDRGRRYEPLAHPTELYGARRLAIAPSDPDTIFAATVPDLWRTRDGGRSWARANVDPAGTMFVSDADIAVDPTDVDNVYFVTSSWFGSPDGFYRSTDAGATFQRTYFDPDGPFGTGLGNRVAIDPARPDVIFVGTGFFSMDRSPLRSVDGGATFSNGPLYFSSIRDIVIDPTEADTLYLAGVLHLSAPPPCGPQGCPPMDPPRAVIRSTDGGVTYSPAGAGLEDRDASYGVVSVIGMVIDPRASHRLYLWSRKGLFMTANRGTTWTLLEGDQTLKAAAYGNTIAIDPKKPDRLYLAGASVLEVELAGHDEDDDR